MNLGATDLFSLGAGFNAQNSSADFSQTVVDVLSAAGDVVCQPTFDARIVALAEYEVCGTPTLALTLGAVVGGYITTSAEYTHEAGSPARITINGTAYVETETLAAKTYALSFAIPALPTSEITTPASGLEVNSVSKTWALELTEGVGANGNVKFVTPRTLKLTHTESGLGQLASAPTMTGFALESYNNSDSNQELDTYSLTFNKGIALT
jgi:hypothetical protein